MNGVASDSTADIPESIAPRRVGRSAETSTTPERTIPTIAAQRRRPSVSSVATRSSTTPRRRLVGSVPLASPRRSGGTHPRSRERQTRTTLAGSARSPVMSAGVVSNGIRATSVTGRRCVATSVAQRGCQMSTAVRDTRTGVAAQPVRMDPADNRCASERSNATTTRVSCAGPTGTTSTGTRTFTTSSRSGDFSNPR